MDPTRRTLASLQAQFAECKITATTEGEPHAPHRGANSVDLRQLSWAEFGPVMAPSIQTVHINFDQLVFVWHYRPYKNVKQFLEQVMPCQRLTVHLPDSEHVYWEGFDSNNRKHWYHLVEFYMKTKALENLRIVEFIRKEEVILAYVQGKSP